MSGNPASGNAERDLLRKTVVGLVVKHAGPEAVRAAMDSERGYDETLWNLLCEQVGAAALLVPEELGGAGGQLGDAAVILDELGKALVPTPLLGTLLAELALLAAPEPDGAALERLAEGSAIGAVVFGDDYAINGDLVGAAGIESVVVGTDGTQLTRWNTFDAEPLSTMDPTRRLGRVTAGATQPIGTDPGIADYAAILLAAEQVGAATRCLDMTVQYTKDRVQFGRPIGSFQALKHRMADLYVAVSAARAVVDDAVAAPSSTSASLARVVASEAFCTVAGEAIQLHGGIAITWESDIQLYFKRAQGSSQLLGQPTEHLRRLHHNVC